MRLDPQLMYPILGLVLGAGAPAGSFVLRFLLIAEVRDQPLADLRTNAFFYLYALIATSLVFALAGFVAGRRVDRLRRGEAFFHELAEHDALTGLHNDRAFKDRYRRALERAVATRQPLAVVLVDVDQLKAINDAFGHPAGSKALVLVAEALRRSKRAADTAARWGGDEFAILLEGADPAAAMRIAEGVLAHLGSTPLRLERATAMVTVTIGICTAAQPELTSDLFAAADRALLTGKAHGRNTIEIVSI
jgi:diguanylate cyclase (GGDEF)-like protein